MRSRFTERRGGLRTEWGLLCIVALLCLPLFTPRLFGADEIKYFSHLRSVYFDGDLHYENEYAHFLEADPVAHAGFRPYHDEPTATGYRLNDAPIGAPLLWSPFYGLADLYVVVAGWLGADVRRDGYSAPYVWGVCLASLVWGMAGLFLTYRLCREMADTQASKVAVLGMWLASPVVFYLYITPPMAHAVSMFTVALFLFVWYKTRDDRATLEWAVMGIAAGLMVLVRELNWLVLMVLVVDELGAFWDTWRHRAIYAQAGGWLQRLEPARRVTGYAAFCATLAVAVAPQFYVYWTLHRALGPPEFIVDKFTWPVHTLEVLFSSFHGLFTWHPVTLLGTLGLLAVARRDGVIALALGSVLAAQVLVIGSYDTWWGGAAFGARRFINCVPIFALGIAVMVDELGPGMRRAAAGLTAVLVLWNFGLAIQYSTGMIPRDEPVALRTIAVNQVTEVPPRLFGVAWRFVFERGSFYRTRPS